MSKRKTISCHDCAKEVKIVDKYEEIEIEEIQYCPLCGGQNIDVNEEHNEKR